MGWRILHVQIHISDYDLFNFNKAISSDPVKVAENPEQKRCKQRIEQHFRTKAEHFGLKTEGKDLKEVRKEITIIEEAKKENVWRTAQALHIKTEGKTMNELIKDVQKGEKIKRGRDLFLCHCFDK